jgi:hypothetical protein
MLTFMRRLLTGPSPDELAARELDAAKRALLQAQSAQEYARSMVIYNQQRIQRLRAYLADQEGDGNPSFG